MKPNPLLPFLPLLVLLNGGSPAIAQAIIARTNDPIPGLTGLTYSNAEAVSFSAPSISSTNTVVFVAGIAGSGVTTGVNDVGMFASVNGTTSLIVRRGDAAPGLAGVTFAATTFSFGTQAGNNSPVYSVNLAGAGVTTANDISIWQGNTLVAREGDAVPGLGANWNSIGTPPVLLADNRHVISGSLVLGGSVTAANDGILMIGTTGNLTTLVREGEAAPGLTGITTTGLTMTGVNQGGAVSIRTTLTGTGVTTTNNALLMAGTAGNMQLLMRSGSTPAGMPSPINSFGTINPVLQNGGVFFGATLTTGTGGVTTSNDGTFWYGTNATDLQLVFREGDQVPGQPAGTLFVSAGISRASGNRVAYTATLSGPAVSTGNDQYVGTFTPAAGLQIVAREGETAPGGGGASYGHFNNSPPLGFSSQPNVDGENILFRSTLTGTGVTTGVNDAAIFLRDANGVRMIARKGDSLDGSTIAELTFGDNFFGTNSGYNAINSDGSLAYLATLTNGSSVVVYVPVPEPGTILGLSLAIGFVSHFGMRKR
jgi:hypothetical protein